MRFVLDPTRSHMSDAHIRSWLLPAQKYLPPQYQSLRTGMVLNRMDLQFLFVCVGMLAQIPLAISFHVHDI
jgi:hypothetical protein